MQGGTNEGSHTDQGQGHPKKHHYFVDGKKYETEAGSLTGAEIKAQIPGFDQTYQLVLEGRHGDPDRVIKDTDSVNLDTNPPLQFYTVPPATFGLR
ncbi:MAG: multiubiquitin domain-containing protein [Armatimonadetes bacterium]|nr:multiubiquitin domain-containing protein [Armatimonadota bacterium]